MSEPAYSDWPPPPPTSREQLKPAIGRVGWWGVYDTKGGCWMGTTEGPLTYSNMWTACVVGRVLDYKLGGRSGPAGRHRAKMYNGTGTKLKDERHEKMTAEAALDLIESGRVL